MAEKFADYDKSVIDIKINFDEDREREFKTILKRQFGNKRNPSEEEDEIISRLHSLEHDFSRRADELRKFRKASQGATSAPILTQAHVRKAKKRLNNSVIQSSVPKQTGIKKFRSIAKVIIIFMTLSKKWRRYHIKKDDDQEKAGFKILSSNSTHCKTPSARLQNNDRISENKKATKSKYWLARSVELLKTKYHMIKLQDKVSEELKFALKTLPEQRGNEDLMKIQRLCRKIGALSNFPVERELDVAKYIAYESYDKGRVLSLQGRKPDRFYFILSGRVNRVKTIEMTSGIKKQYFGQLYQGSSTDANELQLRKPRECSLVCKTFVDLLLVEREDFFNLLATKSSLDNSNTVFIRSIDMFETFPLDSVEKNTMTTKYFPKDTVIVKDIYESPYFFIIKSGTCKLLQKHAVDKRGVPILKKESLSKINRGSVALSLSASLTDENSILNEAKQLYTDVSTFLDGSERWTEITDQPELSTKDVEIVNNRSKKNMKVTQARFGKPKSRGGKLQGLPTLTELIHGQKQGEIRRRGSLFEINETEENGEQAELKLPLITLNSSLLGVSSKLIPSRPESSRYTQVSSTLPLVKRREADAYLHIGFLKKGDVYGLDSLMNRAASMVQAAVTLTVNPETTESLNLVVVSEGTECILVNKKQFLKSADFCTLSRMVSMYQTQTSADEAQEQIEKTRNWGCYKRKIVKDILKKAKEKPKVFVDR